MHGSDDGAVNTQSYHEARRRDLRGICQNQKKVVHRSQLKASKGIGCKQCCQEHMSEGFRAVTYGGCDSRECEFEESSKRKEIEESQQALGYLRVCCQTIIGTWIRGNPAPNWIQTHRSNYLQVTCKDLDPRPAL